MLQKPDPFEKDLLLKGAPSRHIDLFNQLASICKTGQLQNESFLKLTKKEQEQARADTFSRIVFEFAVENLEHDILEKILHDYHEKQRQLRKEYKQFEDSQKRSSTPPEDLTK